MRAVLVGSAFVVMFGSLACMGGSESSAELETLRRQVAEKDAALHAMEAQMATCDCPVAAAPVAPHPVVASAPAPAPAPAAAPAPVDTRPGEVEIKSPPSFKMILDGHPMTYNIVKSVYTAKEVAAGAHVVEVRVGTSDIVHSESISVEPGMRTRYQWSELSTLGIHKKGDPFEQLATVAID